MTKEEALVEINSKIDQITKLSIEVVTLTEKASWNAGIEAAASIVDNYSSVTAEQIRKLKK
jgi:hypothetical protein